MLASRGYRVEWNGDVRDETFTHKFAHECTQVFVLQIEQLSDAEMRRMLELRCAYPAVRWILACHSTSTRWAELVIQFHARGFVDINDASGIGRGIEAVLAGDLWFPRWLANALYNKLLSALRSARLDVGHFAETECAALTSRETNALELMCKGFSNKEIARDLAISVNTVKKHLKAAFNKRGLHSRRQGLG